MVSFVKNKSMYTYIFVCRNISGKIYNNGFLY